MLSVRYGLIPDKQPCAENLLSSTRFTNEPLITLSKDLQMDLHLDD